ncbi:tRNA-guanine transglycosylase DpdA [Phorcysia thermohydrogeniphila]|uniref:Queuine tRNA-ribosyltransferase n=1 Tax=Phorcysia thermohydrogeniphila TaxID=936138 RepID=A0A4R1GJY0_9BACT|nr:tRNA-guanine transglycosylase DpdA [Phorcysia thermohydrogeniphila]TCK04582.1 queuine tRNA-ribosyltransferase [Phorcysia thermohydrogeniphila]
MKFFLPYWEDWVHKDFDPLTDSYSGGYENSIFAHEIYSPPPYDGVLVSLGMFELKLKLIKENGKPKIRGFSNIKDYLRTKGKLPVLGDCGAFTYVNEKRPPLSVEKAASHYHLLGFDYGISVDHICCETVTVERGKEKEFKFVDLKETGKGKLKLTLSTDELEERRQLSLQNAREFLKLSKNASFIPVGAAQGYSVETYIDSVKELVRYGYTFIAIGGLVPRRTDFIKELLKKLAEEVDLEGVRVHLLGVLREELLPEMVKWGIFSFDSASYLRKAWLKAKENYLGIDYKWYASIRVPDSRNPRLKKKIMRSNLSPSDIYEQEQKILRALREYDSGKVKELDALIEDVMTYDRLFFREEFKEGKYEKLYRELLESKVWRECSCPVCRKLGIDVVIFRGSNRNKRRGFHNTYVFYGRLNEFLK